MTTHIYFKGEKLHNTLKCDLINLDNKVGYILFKDLPNSPYIQSLMGKSGNLSLEIEENWKCTWKFSKEIIFYPFEECYWDIDHGVITKLSYRLVRDNKIDNLETMLKDMLSTITSYRDELRGVGASGLLVTRIEEVLDRLDQDCEKLRTFDDLHLTSRKRLISDYGICYKDSKGKFQ